MSHNAFQILMITTAAQFSVKKCKPNTNPISLFVVYLAHPFYVISYFSEKMKTTFPHLPDCNGIVTENGKHMNIEHAKLLMFRQLSFKI